MSERKNPKKIVKGCNLRSSMNVDIVRSECPAIQNVRSIRKRLNEMNRAMDIPQEKVDVLRTALKNAKMQSKVNGPHCETCYHKA